MTGLVFIALVGLACIALVEPDALWNHWRHGHALSWL